MSKAQMGTFNQATHTFMPELKIFKTIRRGRCKSAEAYRQALMDNGYCIEDHADKILDKMPVSKTEVEVDLAIVTGTELGFKNAMLRAVIYRRILEVGAGLCLAEDGPALRLDYPDQQADERLTMAMSPIPVSGGGPEVFGVDSSRSSIRGLIGRQTGIFKDFWRPNHHWVVVVPRK